MVELARERSPSPRPASPTLPRSMVIALGDELDLATAPELERELTADRTRVVEQITLDFSRVEFMDTAGLHALERICEHHRSQGRQVSFRDVPPQATHLFQLAARLGEPGGEGHDGERRNWRFPA